MRMTLRAKRMAAGIRRLRVGSGRLNPDPTNSEEAEVEVSD